MTHPNRAEVEVVTPMDLSESRPWICTDAPGDTGRVFELWTQGPERVARSSTPHALSRWAFARGANSVRHDYDGTLADALERAP